MTSTQETKKVAGLLAERHTNKILDEDGYFAKLIVENVVLTRYGETLKSNRIDPVDYFEVVGES